MKQSLRTKQGGRLDVAVVRCADCRQSWLVPGLRPGEAHACKGCGRRLPVEPRAAQPSRMVSIEMEPPSKPSTGKLTCSPSRRSAST